MKEGRRIQKCSLLGARKKHFAWRWRGCERRKIYLFKQRETNTARCLNFGPQQRLFMWLASVSRVCSAGAGKICIVSARAQENFVQESSLSDIFMLRSTPTTVALNLETNKPLKCLMDCTDVTFDLHWMREMQYNTFIIPFWFSTCSAHKILFYQQPPLAPGALLISIVYIFHDL